MNCTNRNKEHTHTLAHKYNLGYPTHIHTHKPRKGNQKEIEQQFS